MWTFFARLASLVRRGIALIFPFLSATMGHRGLRSGLLWVIHVLLVIAIAVGLFYLNVNSKWLRSHLPYHPIIEKGFLPILFLGLYFLGWQAYWIYRLLWSEGPAPEFPKILDAWKEAKIALEREGIDLTQVPMFLVLGRPAGPETVQTEEGLFKAAKLLFRVQGVPQRLEAPLHVYGGPKAIFVTCAGASLLGQYALKMADQSERAAAGVDWMNVSVRMQATLQPAQLQAMLRGAAQARGGGLEPVPIAGPEPSMIGSPAAAASMGGRPAQNTAFGAAQGTAGTFGQSLGPGAIGESIVPGAPAYHIPQSRSPRLKSVGNFEDWTSQLAYLCRLIASDRRPYCPINGILLLLPIAGSENDDAAEDTALACRLDLESAQAALKVHCPLIALLCDLETITGFREFVERFSDDQRTKRLGKNFPYEPQIAEMERALHNFTEYVCGRVVPDWIYRFFRLEAPGKLELDSAVTINKNLFHLVCQMVERQQRLNRILKESVFRKTNEHPFFAGCYVAGTGQTAAKQAFVAGVFERFVEERRNWQDIVFQEVVMWTREAIEEDAAAWRRIRRGYVFLGAVVVGLLALIGYRFFRK